MADSLATLIKLYAIPGSPSFLLLGLTAGVLILLGPKRWRPLAVAELALLVVLYWGLSVPAVAELLATRFHADPVQHDFAAHRGHRDAIVVLGAGVVSYALHGQAATIPDRQTVFNAFEGARLFRALPGPLPVVASGGVVSTRFQREPEAAVIRDLLIRAGVPSDRVMLETSSRTTYEQAVHVAPIVKQQHWEHVFLVAPSVQMPRAVASFAQQGVVPLPVEAPFSGDAAEGERPSRWVPNGDALAASQRAVYDYFARLYYLMRGRLG